ncbi:hypothetical protein CHUAL_004567 [Chamberlinius hualienensis]
MIQQYFAVSAQACSRNNSQKIWLSTLQIQWKVYYKVQILLKLFSAVFRCKLKRLSMFGVVVSGRLVQTTFERVGETQFLFNVPEADNVNHLVVFMTGTEPFPESMGALVYFGWPDLSSGSMSWQLLGHISNDKPSAIFKIANLKKDETSPHPFLQPVSHVAQIGISVETLSHIALQTPVTSVNMQPNPTQTYVPFNVLQTWFCNFQRRLQQNPYFWRS